MKVIYKFLRILMPSQAIFSSRGVFIFLSTLYSKKIDINVTNYFLHFNSLEFHLTHIKAATAHQICLTIWNINRAKYCPFMKQNICVKYFPNILLYIETIFGPNKITNRQCRRRLTVLSMKCKLEGQRKSNAGNTRQIFTIHKWANQTKEPSAQIS